MTQHPLPGWHEGRGSLWKARRSEPEPGTWPGTDKPWPAGLTFPCQANSSPSSSPTTHPGQAAPLLPWELFLILQGEGHLSPSASSWQPVPLLRLAGGSVLPGPCPPLRPSPGLALAGLLMVERVSPHPFLPPTTASHLLTSQDFVESSLTFYCPHLTAQALGSADLPSPPPSTLQTVSTVSPLPCTPPDLSPALQEPGVLTSPTRRLCDLGKTLPLLSPRMSGAKGEEPTSQCIPLRLKREGVGSSLVNWRGWRLLEICVGGH